ncbi:hypothetical protein A0E43_18790 [Pectobacterium cacticida]
MGCKTTLCDLCLAHSDEVGEGIAAETVWSDPLMTMAVRITYLCPNKGGIGNAISWSLDGTYNLWKNDDHWLNNSLLFIRITLLALLGTGDFELDLRGSQSIQGRAMGLT